jgi:WD40 repeat protein
MAKLLLVHHGEVARERDVAGALATSLREMGHTSLCTWEQGGVAGGRLAALEAAVATVDRVCLINPLRWWAQGPIIDEWQRSLRELVDYAQWAGIDRFAVVRIGDRSQAELEGPLARLSSFILPEREDDLREWLTRPPASEWVLPISEHLPALPRGFVSSDEAIDQIDKALVAARRRGENFVWIRGAVGTGKSALLADWLKRRTPHASEPICHVARPGIAWSCDPERVLTKLVRALLGPEFVGSHGDALARLDADRSRQALVVIDGFEQVIAQLATWPPERAESLRRLFASGIPRCVTVIVTSRPLGPGVLEIAPALDLDAESWRPRQAQIVEQLIRAATPAMDPSRAALVRDHAAGHPGLAAALLAASGTTEDEEQPVETELPVAFAAALERSWTAMLARAGERRAVLRSGLAILVAARESLPVSLFMAALAEEEREIVRSHASEWLHDAGGSVGFVHPFVRRFLAPELDPLDPTPHVRLLDALAALHARKTLDAAAEAYAKQHGRNHRIACNGFDAAFAWVTDVELLMSLAERGELVSRLEAALELADADRSALIEHALAVARRRNSELVEQPSALPSHLWAELVAHGINAAELPQLLHWGVVLPPIRLRNPLPYRDRSFLRFGHSGDVRGCAIDASATRAISVTSDRRLHVWSVRSGEHLANLDIEAWAEGCAISADGKRAVVGAGQRVSLWDLDAKKSLAHHDDHGADVTTVSMSADGRTVLSTDRDGIVRLWRIDGDRRTQLGRQDAVVRCGALSADGRLALTGDDDRRVMVWDIERGERIQTLPGHTYGVGGVAVTRSGALAISVCIGEARVWEPRSGRLIHTHESLGESTHGCVLVDDGAEALVAESGQELHRWSVASGQLRVRHFAHAQDMTCIAATPDGKWYMTGGQDRVARVWRSESIAGVDEFPHLRSITALRASADGCSVWICGGGDGTRRVSIVDGRELARLSPSGAQALAEAGDRVVTVGSNRRVVVHSSVSRDELANWEPTKDWLRACAVDPTGSRLAYGGDEKSVFCSDFEGGNLIRLEGHGDWIRGLAWTPEGRLVSVDDDGELRIWDVAAKACASKCSPTNGSAIYALVLDGLRAFVGGVSGKLASVDLATGQTLVSFDGHDSAVTDLTLTEHGMLVSVSRDATLRIWSVDDTDARMLARYDASYPFTRVAAVGSKVVAGDAAGNHLILDVDWDRLRDA